MLTTKEYSENFAQWCADCVRITDKITGQAVPFILNAPQRRVAALMEAKRKAGQPIRIIMLKARQWGGSTLTQIYMAWMQLTRHKGWNSLICSHVKDASANIRGMYSQLLRNYPEELRGAADSTKAWSFSPYEKSANTGYIPARDCRVAVTSAYAPDAVRGASFQMAHLSEVAFWGDGDPAAAERIVRTVGGSVPLAEDTVVVMESTADGTENYFYTEWQRAVKGESDKIPVFVPWYEIEIYRLHLSDKEKTEWPGKFDEYELMLLHKLSLDVEQVAWYHTKRKEYTNHEDMMAEYPTTATEAFSRPRQPFLSPDEISMVKTGEPTDARDILRLILLPAERHDNCVAAILKQTAEGEYMLDVTRDAPRRDTMADAAADKKIPSLILLPAKADLSADWIAREIDAYRIPVLTLPDDGLGPDSQPLLLTPARRIMMRSRWLGLLTRGLWREGAISALASLRSLCRDSADADALQILREAAAYALEAISGILPSPDDFL